LELVTSPFLEEENKKKHARKVFIYLLFFEKHLEKFMNLDVRITRWFTASVRACYRDSHSTEI